MTYLEDFQTNRPAGVNTAELDAKLFSCAYSGAPVAGEPHEIARAPGNELLPVSYQSPETPEQRLNRRMTEVFGANVMAHLNAAGAEWLADNRQLLTDGFSRVSGQEAWDMARAMRDRTRLPNGNHAIFLERQDGPTYGNLIPHRHDVHVRGYHWYQSNAYNIGHVYPPGR